jgi:broad specificity phosphatase PhoE
MVTTVLLLRHGETALNQSGALRGVLDVPLSGDGKREACQLAARIAREYRLTAIFSSTLLRARSTAEEVARATGHDVQIDERFNDVDYGAWAGRPWDSTHVKLGLSTGVTIGFSSTTAQSRGLCVENG